MAGAWVRAAGRINVIGEHTDHTGGLVLPMAIDLATTVTVEGPADAVVLRSDAQPGAARVALDVADPAGVEPAWARYVAGVVAELRPATGLVGAVTSDLPVGAGLSSSAALQLAVAVALGFEGPPVELARLAQRAEHRASGVPVGIMDQLAIAAGLEGHATLIDCTSLDVTPVPWPDDLAVVAVDSGERRTLVGSAYAERRAQCEAAVREVGPLRDVDVEGITDPVVRRRARHVVRENERVRRFVELLAAGRHAEAGAGLVEGHASLRDDFEVSTPGVDALVERLVRTPGVHGARMTGAGFGGMVVCLCEPGAPVRGLRVRPSAGLTTGEGPTPR